MHKNEIVFMIGTRPELIKIAPVIRALQSAGNTNYTIVNTGQHRDLLEKYWKILNIAPDYNLDVIFPGQDLSSLTVRAITQINDLIAGFTEKPKVILAQGDTTTVMAASIVSFYNDIKFAHLEAGLRSYNLKHPFPEEFNRKVASIAASFHLAPTVTAKNNLISEGVNKNSVYVVGNTVIDALEFIRASEGFNNKKYNNVLLDRLTNRKTILITCHRRENHGESLKIIVSAIAHLLQVYPDFDFIWILHPNPNVKLVIESSQLKDYPNFLLVEPLDYLDLLRLMYRSSIIITDSGGIQEEAPSFGKPLIILREVTERPEAVMNGMAKLAGASKEKILDYFKWALNYSPANFNNPYGDGLAAIRVAELLNSVCN